MDVAMIAVSDGGIAIDKNSVQYNDMRALQKEFVEAGYSCEIIFREEISRALKAKKAIFAHVGTIVNFGGEQQDNLVNALTVINNFKGPVIAFTNDLIDGIKNSDRLGFVRIDRPVYYSDPAGIGNAENITKGLEIIGGITLNQSWEIGKQLSQLPELKLVPKYDYIYGGKNRPKIAKYLKEVVKQNDNGVLYGKINQDVVSKYSFTQKYCFSNKDIRIVNSLGKYSFMFYEKNKRYFTSRVFEQLFSNSIVLFDTKFKELECFWTSDNTFTTVDDLIERLKEPWSWERVHKQHEMAKNFDYDSHIQEEANELQKIIK